MTLRAFEAVETVFARLVSRYGASCSGAGATGDNSSSSSGRTWDPVTTLDVLETLLCSLLSAVVPVLTRATTPRKRANSDKAELKRTRAAQALDAIVGGLYEHILVPAVRAFAPLSEGHLTACLADTPSSRKKTAARNDAPEFYGPDLRPGVHALLEGVLTTLDDVLPLPRRPDFASPSARTGSHARSAAEVPRYVTPHWGKGSETEDGSACIRTLLALECVRTLTSLYIPPSEAPEDQCCSGSSSGQDTSGKRPDSTAQAYSRPPTTAATAATASAVEENAAPAADSARTSGSISVFHSGERPGTASAPSPALGPAAVFPPGRRGPPRAARNLGESARVEKPSGPAHLRPRPREDAVPAQVGVRARVVGLEEAENDRGRGAGAVFAPGAKNGKTARARAKTKTRAERIAKLARRDALWWLCAVLGRLLPSLAPPASGYSHGPDAPEVESEPGHEDLSGDAQPEPAPPCPSPPLTEMNAYADIANVEVYAALADLLRKTRPPLHPRPGFHLHPPRAETPPTRSPPPSPRGHSSVPSNHAHACEDGGGTRAQAAALGGKSPKGREREMTCGHSEGDRREYARAGMDVGMGMSEVERGMLLAVLERAWLGV
ncbi:hypothetical protein C8Q77DRAFT_8386 [Trametes polyzona]|nr:hypothetical protein C8Q77DRAFT_8386 [Trametes polyzona]